MKFKQRLIKILISANLARRISDHLIGEEHPIKHRMAVGTVLMLIGVKLAALYQGFWFHFVPEILGYSIHGTGLIPFLDYLTRKRLTFEAEEGQEKKLAESKRLELEAANE